MKCRFVFHKKFTKPWRCSVATSPQSQLFCVSHFHHEKAYLNLEIASQETQRKLIANNLFSEDETQHRKRLARIRLKNETRNHKKRRKNPKKDLDVGKKKGSPLKKRNNKPKHATF